MMGGLPPWVDDWPLTNLDNAITGLEPHFFSCQDKFDMSPLVAMVVNIVRNFAKKNAFGFQDSIGFLNEWWESVRKRVSHFFRRAGPQAKPGVEILFPVSTLVGDMWGIVDHHVKGIAFNKSRLCIPPPCYGPGAANNFLP